MKTIAAEKPTAEVPSESTAESGTHKAHDARAPGEDGRPLDVRIYEAMDLVRDANDDCVRALMALVAEEPDYDPAVCVTNALHALTAVNGSLAPIAYDCAKAGRAKDAVVEAPASPTRPPVAAQPTNELERAKQALHKGSARDGCLPVAMGHLSEIESLLCNLQNGALSDLEQRAWIETAIERAQSLRSELVGARADQMCNDVMAAVGGAP